MSMSYINPYDNFVLRGAKVMYIYIYIYKPYDNFVLQGAKV
jgi:hypothetical protein